MSYTLEFSCLKLSRIRELPGQYSIGTSLSRWSVFNRRQHIEIRIAHYPPYTSKWNPIEHRVFPHITRAMSGMILTSHLFMKELIEKATTKAGLKVFACIFNRVYETGRKVAEGFKESMRIVFDKHLGQWNYVAMPDAAIL